MIVTESIGRNEESDELAKFLSSEIYYSIIDKSIAELDRRFAGINSDILHGNGALIPGSITFVDVGVINKFATH